LSNTDGAAGVRIGGDVAKCVETYFHNAFCSCKWGAPCEVSPDYAAARIGSLFTNPRLSAAQPLDPGYWACRNDPNSGGGVR
jgi:hypothetical protein